MQLTIKELVMAIVVDVIGGIIVYLITSDLLLTGIMILILISLLYLGSLIKKYYDVLQLSGLESVYNYESTGWLDYFAKSSDIRMIMTRGVRILDSDIALVYKAIANLPKDWNGKIRILLLHPDSEFVKQIAEEFQLEGQQVKDQIITTLRNIQFLQLKYNVKVEVRFYRKRPFWRFTLFDDVGFFSYPLEERYLPFYFKVSKRKQSVYEALSRYFEDAWTSAEPIVK